MSLSERGHGINEVPDELSPCWDHLCSIVKQANDDLQVMLGSGFLAHPISQKSLLPEQLLLREPEFPFGGIYLYPWKGEGRPSTLEGSNGRPSLAAVCMARRSIWEQEARSGAQIRKSSS